MTSVTGAPKFSDRKWLELEKREGIKELVEDTIKGGRAVPPRAADPLTAPLERSEPLFIT